VAVKTGFRDYRRVVGKGSISNEQAPLESLAISPNRAGAQDNTKLNRVGRAGARGYGSGRESPGPRALQPIPRIEFGPGEWEAEIVDTGIAP